MRWELIITVAAKVLHFIARLWKSEKCDELGEQEKGDDDGSTS